MAIVDLNLGKGMTFGVAHILREHGIPFCFATGYDRSVIPKEFAEIPHLQGRARRDKHVPVSSALSARTSNISNSPL
jgi:hypothetical protein